MTRHTATPTPNQEDPNARKTYRTTTQTTIEKAGGICLKLAGTQTAGIPDRLCLMHSKAIFVEVKQAGQHPTTLQKHRIRQLQKHGFTTLIVDHPAKIQEVLDALQAT